MKRLIIDFIIFIGISLGIIFVVSKMETMPNEMPVRLLVVKSESMKPSLNINDIVVTLKTKTYDVGDIITYKNSLGELITHRIIENENQNFITKGDFNNTSDAEIISLNNIVGKVVFVIDTKVKAIVVILINIAIIIYILFLLKGNRKKYEKMD